jgi:hypothetical protein
VKKKHDKPVPRSAKLPESDSFGESWADPHDSNTTRGVRANASGVDVWYQDGPGRDDGYGRLFSWQEWYREGLLPPGAPDGTFARIDDVARAHGIRALKQPAARPISRREDLDIAEPSAEEQRRARLRHLFGDGC